MEENANLLVATSISTLGLEISTRIITVYVSTGVSRFRGVAGGDELLFHDADRRRSLTTGGTMINLVHQSRNTSVTLPLKTLRRWFQI
jgi:hypothetical protein